MVSVSKMLFSVMTNYIILSKLYMSVKQASKITVAQ